jgi:hypothetical protein
MLRSSHRPGPSGHGCLLCCVRGAVGGLGQLCRGGRAARRCVHHGSVPGAGHRPSRRQSRDQEATRRTQDLLCRDGRCGAADRHGVRRHHSHRTAPKLAHPGGRRGCQTGQDRRRQRDPWKQDRHAWTVSGPSAVRRGLAIGAQLSKLTIAAMPTQTMITR